MNATDGGEWWIVGEEGKEAYRFLKRQVNHEARDEMAIGRRRRIIDSGKFKIYVYLMSPADTGEAFYRSALMDTDLGFPPNTTLWDWCIRSYYSFEITFRQYLLSNPHGVLTANQSEASLSYIPVLSGCEFWRAGWPDMAKLTLALDVRIGSLLAKFPAAAEHFGKPAHLSRRDHLMVFAHDWGTVYSPANVTDRVISVVQMSDGHGAQGSSFGVDSIPVPPASNHPANVPPPYSISAWTFGRRRIFAFFAGTCHPADPTREAFCAHLSRLVRTRPALFPSPPTTMLPTQHGISDAVITAAMRASTFCLAPRGWTPTTTRLFDAVYEGCVPVVVGGLGNATGLWGLDWPFGAMLPGLRNAAIVVGEEQIAMLDEILLAVPEEEIVRRQLVLCELGRWAFAYRRALGERGGYAVGCREANATQGCGFGRDKGYLDVPGEEGRDAFDMFLMELAGRADQLGLVG